MPARSIVMRTTSVEYYHVFEQEEFAAFETRTPGYHMVHFTASYRHDFVGFDGQIYLRGTNLLGLRAGF